MSIEDKVETNGAGSVIENCPVSQLQQLQPMEGADCDRPIVNDGITNKSSTPYEQSSRKRPSPVSPNNVDVKRVKNAVSFETTTSAEEEDCAGQPSRSSSSSSSKKSTPHIQRFLNALKLEQDKTASATTGKLSTRGISKSAPKNREKKILNDIVALIDDGDDISTAMIIDLVEPTYAAPMKIRDVAMYLTKHLRGGVFKTNQKLYKFLRRLISNIKERECISYELEMGLGISYLHIV